MNLMRKNVIQATVLLVGLAFNTCYANLSFVLRDSFNFLKNNVTIEHPDKHNFKKAAFTSDWKSDKEIYTYVIDGRVIWQDPSHFYFLASANYGWVLGGKSIEYPLRWDIHGHTKGGKLETGYVIDVCERFVFIPRGGFRCAISDLSLEDQHLTHKFPGCLVNRNGNRSKGILNFPYLGFELGFKSDALTCEKVNFSLSYLLGYGGGHSHTKVRKFFVTDSPSTSNFGSHVKYRDMIFQEWAIAGAYSFAKHWKVALEFDYTTVYNTHNLPVKLQHNKQIVKSGLYAASQRHVMNEYISQQFSIILGVVYSLGEGDVWVTR